MKLSQIAPPASILLDEGISPTQAMFLAVLLNHENSASRAPITASDVHREICGLIPSVKAGSRIPKSRQKYINDAKILRKRKLVTTVSTVGPARCLALTKRGAEIAKLILKT